MCVKSLREVLLFIVIVLVLFIFEFSNKNDFFNLEALRPCRVFPKDVLLGCLQNGRSERC